MSCVRVISPSLHVLLLMVLRALQLQVSETFERKHPEMYSRKLLRRSVTENLTSFSTKLRNSRKKGRNLTILVTYLKKKGEGVE